MRVKRGSVLAALAAVMMMSGCGLKAFMNTDTPEKEAKKTQETIQETETAPENTEAVEYVTDENWEAMVRVYQIIMDNYGTAESLVASGQEDPSGSVEKAAELIEYGKNCERDSLLDQEAGEVLLEMVDTAGKMLDLIKKGGGEIVEIAEPADDSSGGSEEAGSTDSSEGAEVTEGLEDPGETKSAENQQ